MSMGKPIWGVILEVQTEVERGGVQWLQVLKFSVQDPMGGEARQFLLWMVYALVPGFDVGLFECWVVGFYDFHTVELEIFILISYLVLGDGS